RNHASHGDRRPRRQRRRGAASRRVRRAPGRDRHPARQPRPRRRRTRGAVAHARGHAAPGRRLREHAATACRPGPRRRVAGQRRLNGTPKETPMNNRKPPRFAALALALAVGIAAPAFAQSRTPTAPSAAEQQELDAARARLDAAAKQYAELASRYAADHRAMELQHRLLRKPVIGVVLGSDPEGGVRIAAVTPGGAAAEAGLKSGDRIVAVDGKRLAGSDPEARLEAARAAIDTHDEGSHASLRN